MALNAQTFEKFLPDATQLLSHEPEVESSLHYMQLLLQELSLYLGILEGRLRYFNQHGELIPTPEEAALQERQQAETERQRAEKAEAKTAILTQRLRELGIDPDNLA